MEIASGLEGNVIAGRGGTRSGRGTVWNSTTVITPVPLFAIECATFDGTMTPMSGPSFSTWVPIVMSNVPVSPTSACSLVW